MSQQPPVERTPKNKEINEQKALPVLPVRDTVLFPHAVLPLTVGRESSVQLINSLGEDKTIIVVAQREARVDSPQPSDLYSVGTSAVVHKVVKMPNQSLFVFAEGLEEFKGGFGGPCGFKNEINIPQRLGHLFGRLAGGGLVMRADGLGQVRFGVGRRLARDHVDIHI